MVSTSLAAMGFGTGSNSVKRKAGWSDRASGMGNENSDDSEDDEQVLRDMLGKQNLKEGAKVASDTSKKMHKKDKDKVTGGGSFQSLGAVELGLTVFRDSLLMRCLCSHGLQCCAGSWI